MIFQGNNIGASEKKKQKKKEGIIVIIAIFNSFSTK